jgi:hypothetical protein
MMEAQKRGCLRVAPFFMDALDILGFRRDVGQDFWRCISSSPSSPEILAGHSGRPEPDAKDAGRVPHAPASRRKKRVRIAHPQPQQRDLSNRHFCLKDAGFKFHILFRLMLAPST